MRVLTEEKAKKIQIYAAWFMRLTVLLAVILAAVNKNWETVFASSVILVLLFIPELIERRYRIFLPVEFEFIIIAFLYASLFLGEIHGYYTRFWWWDVVLHTGSGLALGLAGFLILLLLYRNKKIAGAPGTIALFAFCFAVAIGAVWEIFEFGMDQLFGFNMQKSGLIDTMWDLIVDAAGALITSAVGYMYLKTGKSSFFGHLVESFIEENKAEKKR